MGPADSRSAVHGHVFPLPLGSTHAHGPPRFLTGLSMRAVPNHPGGTRWLRVLAASPPVPGFTVSGKMATHKCVTRPNRVHLRYGSHLRLRRLQRMDLSTGFPGAESFPTLRCSFGYMSSEQFTWQPPFRLRVQPSFAWRTRDHGEHRELHGFKRMGCELTGASR